MGEGAGGREAVAMGGHGADVWGHEVAGQRRKGCEGGGMARFFDWQGRGVCVGGNSTVSTRCSKSLWTQNTARQWLRSASGLAPYFFRLAARNSLLLRARQDNVPPQNRVSRVGCREMVRAPRVFC